MAFCNGSNTQHIVYIQKNVYSIRIIRETYKELEVVMYMYIYNKLCLHLTSSIFWVLFSVMYCMSCVCLFIKRAPPVAL